MCLPMQKAHRLETLATHNNKTTNPKILPAGYPQTSQLDGCALVDKTARGYCPQGTQPNNSIKLARQTLYF